MEKSKYRLERVKSSTNKDEPFRLNLVSAVNGQIVLAGEPQHNKADRDSTCANVAGEFKTDIEVRDVDD